VFVRVAAFDDIERLADFRTRGRAWAESGRHAALMKQLPNVQKLAGDIFAVNYASFGVVMILFLVLEPLGLVGIWHRLQNYFLLWPFKQRPLASARK